jgi:7-keto-8-aminopelargonate synthetase-like enzyme
MNLAHSQTLSQHERQLEVVNQVAQSSAELGITFQTIQDKELDGRMITINKRPFVNFGSCSYLGLETDQRLKQGVIDAVLRYGTQFASSRAFLSVALYEEIEALLTEIFEAPTILGPTTTLAHQSNIPVLIGDQDAVILDQQVHESVQTAVKLLKLRNIHIETVRHNRMDMLEDKIKTLGQKFKKVWYLADGVYSMLGDFAPMQALTTLLNKYGQFNLYIDDAHGMSCFGKNGAGYVKSQLWQHERVYLVTSIAKSFSACGGVMIFPDEATKQKVRHCGGTMLFSGPIQPPILGAAVASAKIHLSSEITTRQEALQHRVDFFNKKAEALSLPLIGKSESPIFFIGMGKPETGYQMIKKLMEYGYYANLSVFPSVSIKHTGLRIPITLHHTYEDIENLLEIVAEQLPVVLAETGAEIGAIYNSFERLARVERAKKVLQEPAIS